MRGLDPFFSILMLVCEASLTSKAHSLFLVPVVASIVQPFSQLSCLTLSIATATGKDTIHWTILSLLVGLYKYHLGLKKFIEHHGLINKLVK